MSCENYSMSYAVWADLLLALHALIPLFILGGLLAILLGRWRDWRWVRNRGYRITHAAMMGVVLAQALMGRLCPLTLWEHELRVRAGTQDASAVPESFIAFWVGKLLYHDLPPAFFIVAYFAVMLTILALWRLVPPTPFKSHSDTTGHDENGRGAGGNRTHE